MSKKKKVHSTPYENPNDAYWKAEERDRKRRGEKMPNFSNSDRRTVAVVGEDGRELWISID